MAKQVAYFGYDFFSSCLEAILGRAEYSLARVFTGHPSELATTSNIIRIAGDHGIPVARGRPSPKEIRRLIDDGIEIFIAAAYSFRVPCTDEMPFPVNIHPSLLPEGRGPNPLPLTLSTYPKSSGLTLHVMREAFDEGPILLQHPVPCLPTDTFHTLAAKYFVEAPKALGLFLDNPEDRFGAAREQEEGSYWPLYSVRDRSIQEGMSVGEAQELYRSYSGLGLRVPINGDWFEAFFVQFVSVDHHREWGAVVYQSPSLIYLALEGGVAIISRDSMAGPLGE